MKKISIILLFSYCLIMAQGSQQNNSNWPILSQSPWPMTFGNPQANGRTAAIGPKTSNILWQINKPYGTSGGPVISSTDVLYFASEWNVYFYAMNKDTTVKWTYKGDMINYTSGAMLVDRDENIYLGSNNSYFNAFDKNGNVKWKIKTGGPILVPMINIGLDSVLYFTSNDKNLYAVHSDGTLKWKVSLESGFAHGSPVLSPDYKLIYICGTDSNCYALNLDGSLKWKYSCRSSNSVPLVDAQGNIYLLTSASSTPGAFISISPAGALRWTYSFEGQVSPTDGVSPCMDINGNLFIANREKVFSFDSGGKLRWTKTISPAPNDIACPLVCDAEGKVYFGCTEGTYYYCYSNDGTMLWSLPLNGHMVDRAPAFGSDGTLYIGVHKGPQKVSMIAVKDKLTSVNDKAGTPLQFVLSQNYPNPFNPSTTISYSIPESRMVTLKIYDLLGREVATLLNEYKEAGTYSVSLNASSLPSGTYIYTIQTGKFRDSKKLVLLK